MSNSENELYERINYLQKLLSDSLYESYNSELTFLLKLKEYVEKNKMKNENTEETK